MKFNYSSYVRVSYKANCLQYIDYIKIYCFIANSNLSDTRALYFLPFELISQ